MILKIIGSIMIIASSCCIGNFSAERLAGRCRNLQDFITVMVNLENEILFKATPLSEALFSCSKITNEGISSFLRKTASDIGRKTGKSTREIWYNNTQMFKERLCLEDSDADIIKSLGATIGALDTDIQANSIKLCQKNLSYALQSSLENKEKYIKVYKNAGVLIGIFISILFI